MSLLNSVSRPSVFTLITIVITILVLTCLLMPIHAGERVGWMYNADVPVTNQSPQARAIAAQEGFRQVLGRLTGQGDALTLNVSGMAADRLISTFSYHSEIVDGRRQPRVKMSFNPSQTLATVRRAGLPVWGSGRPEVKLYLLVEGADGSWRPLTQGEPAELAMQRRAWIRGIKLSVQDFTENAVPVRQMLLGEPEPEASTVEGEEASSTGTANFRIVEPAVDASASLTGSSNETDENADFQLKEEEPPPEPFLPGVIPSETELVVVGELRYMPTEGDPVLPAAATTTRTRAGTAG